MMRQSFKQGLAGGGGGGLFLEPLETQKSMSLGGGGSSFENEKVRPY